MDRPSADESFPARISHSLTLALGIVVATVLLVGGTSIALVGQIVANNDAVTEEYSHLLRLDQLHSAFDDLIFELHQMDSTGRLDRATEAILMQEEIARQLRAVEALHQGELGPAQSQHEALLKDLRGLSDQGLAITKSLAAGTGRLVEADLEWLNRATHEVPRQAEVLAALHRSRIARLLESSRGRLRIVFLLYVAFLVVGLMLVLAARVAATRGITSPLRGLSDAARRIAEGRLETRVRIRSRNEIGLLSHTFNLMADRLQQRDRELEERQRALESRVREAQALHRIGTEISRFVDVGRMLQSIADTARELLQGDAVVLCLFTPDRERLVARARSGPAEAFGTEGAPPDDEAVPVILPEYARSHLAAPLLVGDDHVGTIYVGTREAREFTAGEGLLLAGLAAQGAICIERARLQDEVRSLATLEERERLAREMHDGLAQALGLLHLKLSGALARTTDAPALAAALREMVQVTDGAYQDLRQSIFGLRTFVSRGLGLVPSLTEYLHEFSTFSGIAVELDSAVGSLGQVSPATEVQAVRIIQEALTNVRKHAGVDRASVRLQRVGAWIQVSIEDAGKGCDPAASLDPLHFGLATMRERAAGLGGRLEIDTAPGRGTRVVATLPGGAT